MAFLRSAFGKYFFVTRMARYDEFAGSAKRRADHAMYVAKKDKSLKYVVATA